MALVRGRLAVREPPATGRGRISGELFYRIAEFVRQGDLGMVFPQGTGFKIASDPDTVRAPDVAFVSADRAREIPPEGYAELAPDLVVEVVSARYRPGEFLAKLADWLDAGTCLVWVIDPCRSEAHVHRADGSVTVLSQDDRLEGEDLLPGLVIPLGEILT